MIRAVEKVSVKTPLFVWEIKQPLEFISAERTNKLLLLKEARSTLVQHAKLNEKLLVSFLKMKDLAPELSTIKVANLVMPQRKDEINVSVLESHRSESMRKLREQEKIKKEEERQKQKKIKEE